MALQISWLNSSRGVSHPTAYLRVETGRSRPGDRWAECSIAIYHDLAVAKPPGYPQFQYEPEAWLSKRIEGDNFDTYMAEAVLKQPGNSPLTQWYRYLKTLNPGALDV